MRRSLILVAALLAAGPASAHAIFPGSQTVRTAGERAFVTLHAVNARKDVTNFKVEIFDYETWRPSRIAIATPERLVIPTQTGNDDVNDRAIRVLVDLDGKPQQHLRVCTKSVTPRDMFQPKVTEIATRVCANVLVERY